MLDKNGHILIKGEGGQIEKRAGSNKGVKGGILILKSINGHARLLGS